MNPFLAITNEFTLDDEKYDLTKANIYRHFKNAYILCPLNKDVNLETLLDGQTKFNETLLRNFVLYQTKLQIISEDKHFNDILILDSDIVECCNLFNYELDETIVVIPIYTIPFLHLQTYIDNCFQNKNTLRELYEHIMIQINMGVYNKNNRYNKSGVYNIINNLTEANYWTIFNNHHITLNDNFSKRNFDYAYRVKVDDNVTVRNQTTDYLKELISKKFTNKYNYNLNSKFYYEHCDMTLEEFNYIDNKLCEVGPIGPCELIKQILVTKQYSHFVTHNINVLQHIIGNEYFNQFGYAFCRLYLEELAKKHYLKTSDNIVFDLNTANWYKRSHFIKQEQQWTVTNCNTNLPLLVNNIYYKNNVFGCMQNENYKLVDIETFKQQLNIFITGSEHINIFKDFDFKQNQTYICGSVIPACLHNIELSSIRNGMTKKQFYNYHYNESDVDMYVLCDGNNDFVKKSVNVMKCIQNNLGEYEESTVTYEIKKGIFVRITKEYITDHFENPEEIINDFENHTHVFMDKIKEYDQQISSTYDFTNYCDVYDLSNINISLVDYNENGFEVMHSIKFHISVEYENKTTKIELFSNLKHNDPMTLVTNFHLNCVRGYYDGEMVYMTPSCLMANVTMINMDYKYVSGNTNPMEIINKYRKRGFGTILNENEMMELFKYSMHDQKWKQEYENAGITTLQQFMKFISDNNKFFNGTTTNKNTYKINNKIIDDNGYIICYKN